LRLGGFSSGALGFALGVDQAALNAVELPPDPMLRRHRVVVETFLAPFFQRLLDGGNAAELGHQAVVDGPGATAIGRRLRALDSVLLRHLVSFAAGSLLSLLSSLGGLTLSGLGSLGGGGFLCSLGLGGSGGGLGSSLVLSSALISGDLGG